MEIEIAKENEVVQLSGIGTVKSVRFLRLGFLRCAITTMELVGHDHEHNSLGKVQSRVITEWIFSQVFVSSFFLVSLGIWIIDDRRIFGDQSMRMTMD